MEIYALVIHKISGKLYVVNLERNGGSLYWQITTEGIYGKVVSIYRDNMHHLDNSTAAAPFLAEKIGCPILPSRVFLEVIGEYPGMFPYEEGDL